MGGGLWQGFFLQTGAKSKVNEASQKRSLELEIHTFIPVMFLYSTLLIFFSLTFSCIGCPKKSVRF